MRQKERVCVLLISLEFVSFPDCADVQFRQLGTAYELIVSRLPVVLYNDQLCAMEHASI